MSNFGDKGIRDAKLTFKKHPFALNSIQIISKNGSVYL